MVVGEGEGDGHRGEQHRPAQQPEQPAVAPPGPARGAEREGYAQHAPEREGDEGHGAERERRAEWCSAERGRALALAIGDVQRPKQLQRGSYGAPERAGGEGSGEAARPPPTVPDAPQGIPRYIRRPSGHIPARACKLACRDLPGRRKTAQGDQGGERGEDCEQGVECHRRGLAEQAVFKHPPSASARRSAQPRAGIRAGVAALRPSPRAIGRRVGEPGCFYCRPEACSPERDGVPAGTPLVRPNPSIKDLGPPGRCGGRNLARPQGRLGGPVSIRALGAVMRRHRQTDRAAQSPCSSIARSRQHPERHARRERATARQQTPMRSSRQGRPPLRPCPGSSFNSMVQLPSLAAASKGGGKDPRQMHRTTPATLQQTVERPLQPMHGAGSRPAHHRARRWCPGCAARRASAAGAPRAACGR